MKSIAVFNNKGGVGKTTLTYHTACALAELGHRTLLVDLDPQSNLTLYGLTADDLYRLWRDEDPFIEDFGETRKATPDGQFQEILNTPRSIHFILKPTEDGTGDLEHLPNTLPLLPNLDLVPGRLTVHMYENKIASRWSEAYQSDPLAIRTISRIRQICDQYAIRHGYEFVLYDTSPSLGILNKVIISLSDGFIVPCMPDMFSLYGIRNIGSALAMWKREFEIMRELLSVEKQKAMPAKYVQFLGYTIYNAKKYAGAKNEWDLAQAHYNYAKLIPETVMESIPEDLLTTATPEVMANPIGGAAVMHTHNTLPTHSQKYRLPIWSVPDADDIDEDDKGTIAGNQDRYRATQARYHTFATDMLTRVEGLG